VVTHTARGGTYVDLDACSRKSSSLWSNRFASSAVMLLPSFTTEEEDSIHSENHALNRKEQRKRRKNKKVADFFIDLHSRLESTSSSPQSAAICSLTFGRVYFTLSSKGPGCLMVKFTVKAIFDRCEAIHCETAMLTNESPESVGEETSHEWNVKSCEEFGARLDAAMVTMDCARCGAERSVFLTQEPPERCEPLMSS